jgi:hypothetical protein
MMGPLFFVFLVYLFALVLLIVFSFSVFSFSVVPIRSCHSLIGRRKKSDTVTVMVLFVVKYST